jgi:hypothetical protein
VPTRLGNWSQAATLPRQSKGAPATGLVNSRGGRLLNASESGNHGGFPIFALHGAPGSRLGVTPKPTMLHRLGARIVACDRPRYGRASQPPNRQVADAAEDVRAIADHTTASPSASPQTVGRTPPWHSAGPGASPSRTSRCRSWSDTAATTTSHLSSTPSGCTATFPAPRVADGTGQGPLRRLLGPPGSAPLAHGPPIPAARMPVARRQWLLEAMGRFKPQPVAPGLEWMGL